MKVQESALKKMDLQDRFELMPEEPWQDNPEDIRADRHWQM